MEAYEKFRGIQRELHSDIPADQRVMHAIGALGLADECARAQTAAPGFTDLALQALRAGVPGTKARVESARARWERDREARRAEQGTFDLRDLNGASSEALKGRLSFAEYWYQGELWSIEALLADSLARAAVRAELAREEAELRARHEGVRRDLMVWAELTARADANDELASAAE